MLGKRRDIGYALSQRLKLDGDDVEPIKQIFPEPALLYPLLQIAVRGGDNTDIDFLRSANDRRDNALLNCAQDLGLHRKVHVADLVQKQRPAVRLTERPLALKD